MNIKSPLRYPGGKTRAIKKISQYLPSNFSFSEFREPFVGGGTVFIYLKQTFPNLNIWINDLNPELYYFWYFSQTNLSELVTQVEDMKREHQDGKLLFKQLAKIDVNTLSPLQRAVRFFVLNRITFSGTIESGGFSLEAFNQRFTPSSIDRLKKVANILTPDINITNLDYSDVINKPGEDVFIFLDPPYFKAENSKLYGKNGNLHKGFDHQKLAETLKQCPHKWLITYDDSPEIRNNFQWANIREWQLQYGMNNYKQKKAEKGDELFISNYDIQ